MSDRPPQASQGESSLVSRFLNIVGGGGAVVAIGAGVVMEAPLLAVGGLAVGVGLVANAMLSGGSSAPNTPTNPNPTGTGVPDKPQDPPTRQAKDTSALQKRIETTIGVLRVLGAMGSGDGSGERKELEGLLAGLRDGKTAPEEMDKRATSAETRVGQVLKALPGQLAENVMTPRNELDWAPFKTGGTMGDLDKTIAEAEDIQKRLAAAAATLSTQAGLGGDRYVLRHGEVAIAKAKDDPGLSGELSVFRDAAKQANDAAAPLPDAVAKAKAVLARRAKAKKGAQDSASEVGKQMDALVKLRDTLPKDADQVIARAADLEDIKNQVVAARKAARTAASWVDDWKASETNDLTSALAAAQKADNDVQLVVARLEKFEEDDERGQAAGRRVYANMESIAAMLDAMDQACSGPKVKQERKEARQLRDSARLTAPTLTEAVAESVELHKTVAKEVNRIIDAASKQSATTTAKPPRFAATTSTAPTYTYALGTPAVANWGTYNTEMQELIAEITTGGVSLNETFELSFSKYKNHSQGARRTKAYLDASTMGGSTVMRGYFEWTLTQGVVTVTPIAVTEEHGPHVRVLEGSL